MEIMPQTEKIKTSVCFRDVLSKIKSDKRLVFCIAVCSVLPSSGYSET